MQSLTSNGHIYLCGEWLSVDTKKTCVDFFGLHAQNYLTILDAIVNIRGGPI